MMLRLVVIFMTLSFFLSLTSAKSKWYSGEDKPYKFGFNIQGNQHRHEEKDENGLIMGEFGFITADGVYHVTVYATDENGNFKILSMKNIRLGETPENPPPNATPITEFTTTTPAPPPPPPTTESYFTTPKASNIVSCSHCSIPEPPKPPAPAVPQYQQPQQNLQTPIQPQQNYPGQNQYPQQDNQYPQQDNQYPQQGNQYPQQENQYPQQGSQYPQQPQYPDQPAEQFPVPGAPGPFDTPVLVSGQLQTVDPSVLNSPLKPGEQPGLPNGITEETMSELLYRFNYTLGFHGHREEGYANGAKVGEYFINFRNGLATRVSYVANEHGYFPKIQTVRISALETPHPDTEKNPEFGLKGYEFKWFHAPRYNNLHHSK